MHAITPESIADVMALVPMPRSFSELDEMVRAGLPKSALHIVVGHVGRTFEERKAILNSIISESTYKHRSTHLTPAESERA